MALLRSEFRPGRCSRSAADTLSVLRWFGFDLLISHHRLGAWSRAVCTRVHAPDIRCTIYICTCIYVSGVASMANISGEKDLHICSCASMYTGNATYLYALAAVGLSAGRTAICRVAIRGFYVHRQIITVFDMPAGHSHGRVIKPFLYYTGRAYPDPGRVSAFLVALARDTNYTPWRLNK